VIEFMKATFQLMGFIIIKVIYASSVM